MTTSNSPLDMAYPLTTMLYDPNQGGFYLLDRHYARLDSGAKALFSSSEQMPSLEHFKKALRECVDALGHDIRQRIRVVLDSDYQFNVTATALPKTDTRLLPLRLDTVPTPITPMATHKSTARDVYDIARTRVHADYASNGPLCDRPFDVLMWNPSGNITETSIANFAVYLRGPELLSAVPTWNRGPRELAKGTYVTPSLCKGLIAGVMRTELLEKGMIVEGTITRDDVMRYSKNPDSYNMICFNAVRGSYPVYLMDGQPEFQHTRAGLFQKAKHNYLAPPNLSIPAPNFSIGLRTGDTTPGTTPPLTPISSIRPSSSSSPPLVGSEVDFLPETLLPPADPTPRTPFPWRRGVIIDCYDSYTNNLLQLFEQETSSPAGFDAALSAHVAILRADQISWPEFRSQVLPNLDFVILSPGPGSPHVPADIGVAGDLLLALTAKELAIQPIPVLGICLGHQALAALLGGRVVSSGELVHGRTVPIQHNGTGVFKGMTPRRVLHMIRYNSLTVDPATLPSELDIVAVNPEDGEVMGLQHKTLPLYGVQFHPESISSRRSNYNIDAGKLIVRNFMDIVDDFWVANGRPQRLPLPLDVRKLCVLNTVDSALDDSSIIENLVARDPIYSVKRYDIGSIIPSFAQSRPDLIFEATTYSPHAPFFWLDSAAAAPGDKYARFSYMGLTSFDRCISYDLSSDRVTYGSGKYIQLKEGDTFWQWMDRIQVDLSALVQIEEGAEGLQCGFVGYFGYEMKVGSLPGYDRASLSDSSAPHAPDAQFMFADRLIAYDHWNKTWTAFGLVRTGTEDRIKPILEQETEMQVGMSDSEFSGWLEDIKQRFSKLASAGEPTSPQSQTEPLPLSFTYDSGSEVYKSSIQACKSHIADGNSYELCLTGQFSASARGHNLDYWAVYKHFRVQNPASHAAFVSFPMTQTTIISCSPELFIRFDGANGRQAAMKPIKGTLKRSKCMCSGLCKLPMCGSRKVECDASRYKMDKERVRAFVNDPKETAENLMIADLIRANLLEFCGTSSVDVPKLNALETYENVYSLVSTITGELLPSVGTVEGVRRCFPPGSMTGAPKLRSVQLLDGLETTSRRGIYSGCLGFLSLDNRAVFSVVIRTLVAYQDQLTYGAGGAITWLSDVDGEWNEVLLKARSVLKDRVLESN
ncbi:Para-aminobenzoate synthase [Rhizoctonia solani]|uniref:aminodeoxychorismate synthase n=1 Tax=Rhizoctonia solani TaxID=456999 RepID=A0A8H7H6Q2_9AGAM|nr:Para-aminobenzoate synthase [Rhizoctonia solani]